MRKIIIISISLVMLFISCSKDEQPRYKSIDILKKTGEMIVKMENHIDSKRSTLNPEGYDKLADYCTAKVDSVLKLELSPDGIAALSKNGDIANVIETYIEYHRDKHPNKKSKVWTKIRIGIDDDVYRVRSDYGEKLLISLKKYCEGVVTGPIEWSQGQRSTVEEQKILDLFHFDPDEEWSYRGRLWDYFRNFAVDPNVKSKYKKEGFLNLGWFD